MKTPGAVLSLLLSLLPPPPGAAAEPLFAARTAAGKEVRGPLRRLAPDWTVELGKGVRHKVAGAELLGLRQAATDLPGWGGGAEQLVLTNGDRVPVRDLRLGDEKLFFRNKDLGPNEASLPVAVVRMIWRLPPDGVADAETFRRALLLGKRSQDRVLLRNGDTLQGTLSGLGAGTLAVEAGKKAVKARWEQVAVVAFNTELLERLPAKGPHARVVLTPAPGSPGGRLTLTSATCDGQTFRGKTAFGALLRVPVGRVAALEVLGGKALPLAEQAPAKYTYFPYLDEKWSWSAGANVLGRALRVGGSVYDDGVGMHASSALSYALDGGCRRFEATAGLDDRDGRRGRVRLRVLVDGKPADLGNGGLLTHAGGPRSVRVDVRGAKTLTLEVVAAEDGPVQGVVNWVDARLVK
jgi:hypothetical protein